MLRVRRKQLKNLCLNGRMELYWVPTFRMAMCTTPPKGGAHSPRAEKMGVKNLYH